MPYSKKNSFIVYHDQKAIFDELSDEDAGKLIKAMLEYSSSRKIPKLTVVLRMAFIPIKQQLDRNISRYEVVCAKNKNNILKRWNSSTKHTTVYDRIRPDTKNTDKDKDKDKDKDNITPLTPQRWGALWDKRKPSKEYLASLADSFKVPPSFVESRWDDLQTWCMAKGKTYKRWDWALRDWVKRDAIKLKQGGKNGRHIAIIPIPD